MNITCNIVMDYASSKKAHQVYQSITIDDLTFVSSKIDGASLTSQIQTHSLSSLLHTLDDYLACVSVAEKIVDKS